MLPLLGGCYTYSLLLMYMKLIEIMTRIFISILLLFMCAVTSFAQSTKEKARALFNDGNYVEAKPIFESLLKKTPKDGSYNYWYAACCFETNDTVADIEKMLKYATTRRVNDAYRYLGHFYKSQ